MHITEQGINQSSIAINQQTRKSHMLGPTNGQFILTWINSINSIIILKIKESCERYLMERKWQKIIYWNDFGVLKMSKDE